MSSFSMLTIAACEADFEQFKDRKTLGVGYAPKFSKVMYDFARDAYRESWQRAFMYSWKKEAILHNERANERMRAAFATILQRHVGDQAADRQGPPLPVRDATFDIEWFKGIIEHVAMAHAKIFRQEHHAMNAYPAKLESNVVTFYQTLMSIAWNAAWEDGERAAKIQFARRETQAGNGEANSVRLTALRMEQECLFDSARSLFELHAEVPSPYDVDEGYSDVQRRSSRDRMTA